MTLTTPLKIQNWDETTIEQLDGGGKLARAEVSLGAGPDGLGPATYTMLAHHSPDGTSRYVSLMRVDATIDGKSGSVVLLGEGGYDGTTARSTNRVVRGTGELAGVTGTAESSATQEDYPNMPLTLHVQTG